MKSFDIPLYDSRDGQSWSKGANRRRRTTQAGAQAGESLLGPVILHRHGERFLLSDQHHQLLASSKSGVDQVALQQ